MRHSATLLTVLYAFTGLVLTPPVARAEQEPADEEPVVEIVLDDDSLTGVTFSGEWFTSSANSGFWGVGFRHDGNTGKGTKTATFKPTLDPVPHQVYLGTLSAVPHFVDLWHTPGYNRAANVPVDIVHATGTNTVIVNQQLNAWPWRYLGTYTFNSDGSSYVQVRTTGTSGFVIVDAVKFVPTVTTIPTTPVITLTATDPTAGEPGNVAGTATFTFTRTGSTAGELTVNFSVSGTATSGSDYASLGNSVTFADGATVASIILTPVADDLAEASETVVVTLTAGSGYTLGNPSSATATIADQSGTGVELIVDDTATESIVITGDWISSASNPGYWASGYRHDDNTDKGAKSIAFTAPTAPGDYDVFIWYTSDPNRAINVPVDIGHANGTSTVTVNQRLNGSTWVPLGTYTFNGEGGAVTVRNTGTTGYVIADAVRFVARQSGVADLACFLDPTGSAIDLRWSAVAGTEYVVYGAERLGDEWQEIDRVTSNGAVQSYSAPIAGSSIGFFRVTMSGARQ